MSTVLERTVLQHAVQINTGKTVLEADLVVPGNPKGVVLFCHGSDTTRASVRNRRVAGMLQEAGLATLLVDLLTPAEAGDAEVLQGMRYDIDVLGERVVHAIDWIGHSPYVSDLGVGCLGAGAGAAAALIASVARPEEVRAVVSRGGRPDLAGAYLGRVTAPTLLVVGCNNHELVELNRLAFRVLGDIEKRIDVLPDSKHLFDEPDALEEASELTAEWFVRHLDHFRLPKYRW